MRVPNLVQPLVLLAAVIALTPPLGAYIARVMSGERTYLQPVLGWALFAAMAVVWAAMTATFAAATTGTSTGAVNSFHDSYTAAGGLVPTAHMLLGEVSPGPLVEQLLQGTGRLF